MPIGKLEPDPLKTPATVRQGFLSQLFGTAGKTTYEVTENDYERYQEHGTRKAKKNSKPIDKTKGNGMGGEGHVNLWRQVERPQPPSWPDNPHTGNHRW
jgi:hypothetical protein